MNRLPLELSITAVAWRFFQQLGRAVIILILRTYKYLISPILGPRCRHLPTCSEYAEEAIEIHGLLRGTYLSVKRLSRCHPWGSSGYDPVPEPKHEA